MHSKGIQDERFGLTQCTVLTASADGLDNMLTNGRRIGCLEEEESTAVVCMTMAPKLLHNAERSGVIRN